MDKIRRYISILGIACLGCCGWTHAARVDGSQLEGLKEQLEGLQQESDELRNAREELKEALGDLNLELEDLSLEIAELGEAYTQTEAQIARTEQEYKQAEDLRQKQYEDMKLRIQYMYENGNSFGWEMLLTAGSFADFLNRLEYISQINAADRRMMEQYEESCRQIEAYRGELEEQRQTLLHTGEELDGKKNTLLASISERKANLENTQNALGDKQQETEELAEKIKAMEEYERKLEEQRAKEEAARLEEIKRQEEELARQKEELAHREEENEQTGEPKEPVQTAVGEEELFAALLYCEAGGEPYEGQLAVGSVVLNRVRSSYFPDNITDVIYQKGQFSPVASGKLALVLEKGLTTDSCRKAVREVLEGNITGDWLYFRMDNGTIDGDIIGNQVFY